MPSTYKTPGVYIEEISTLPASIAQVETAIPAFVGYTQKSRKNGKELQNVPTKIDSLLDFEEYFGKGPDLEISVSLKTDNSVDTIGFNSLFCLYDSIRMFYSNGGGECYIVSVGDYSESDTGTYYTELKGGLDTLRKEDEPTLILFPDAAKLFGTDPDDATSVAKDKLGTLQKDALKQCNDLQDRFCIFDVADGDKDLDESDNDGKEPDLAFRDNVGVQYLKYGASYYPYLKSNLSFDFGYGNLKDAGGNSLITKNSSTVSLAAISSDGTFASHYDKVLADAATFEQVVDSPDHSANGGDTDLLDVVPFTSLNVYDGYEAIEEELAGSGTTARDRIHARIQYLWEMVNALATLTITDNEDEDEDASTDKHLNAILDNLVKPVGAGVNYTEVEELVRKLLAYNEAVTNGTTTTAGVFTDLSIGATVTIGAYDYDTNGVVADDSIYGSPSSWSEAADNSKATFQEMFEEISSIYKSFAAEIALRKENLEVLLEDTNPIYSDIVSAIRKEGIVLPPSGAIAGVYAATDNERGVWVAPANRSLNSVMGPKVNITAKEQEGLNVDVTAGKSINAIRSFTGKGTLVWGARTLAGNSNEWRYVPVRRLFNMVEESVKKATEFVVFEPNDKNTWVRTKAMIENFLNQIWKAGGLAGAKAEHAYIVKVGLGETMTSQDILEGRMIVEIHLAAVRPAEFIILRFMHKLQES